MSTKAQQIRERLGLASQEAAASLEEEKEPISIGPKAQAPPVQLMSLKDRIELLRLQKKSIREKPRTISPADISNLEGIEEDHTYNDLNLTDRYGEPITLNKKQGEAVDMAIAKENFVISGEAGTGKTTTLQAAGKALWIHHNSDLHPVDYRATDGSGVHLR